MNELDGLLDRINNLCIPIDIKGRRYMANNPYLLNTINNLLYAGKLSLNDIAFDTDKIEVMDKDTGEPYLYYPELDKISTDIGNEYNEIRDLKRAERNAARNVKAV